MLKIAGFVGGPLLGYFFWKIAPPDAFATCGTFGVGVICVTVAVFVIGLAWAS